MTSTPPTILPLSSATAYPRVTFLCSYLSWGPIISLSTGSSYGTFAILMPIAVPVGFELGRLHVSHHRCCSQRRAVFGDHCSPISDTTVLASVGADCDHLSHVTSQGAYAGITGLITLFAYAMAGVFETPLVLLIAIVALAITMTLVMRIFGERSPTAQSFAKQSG